MKNIGRTRPACSESIFSGIERRRNRERSGRLAIAVDCEGHRYTGHGRVDRLKLGIVVADIADAGPVVVLTIGSGLVSIRLIYSGTHSLPAYSTYQLGFST